MNVLMQYHDELLFVCLKEYRTEVEEILKQAMIETNVEQEIIDNNEDNIEDDTVLLEDETDIDPAADAGIITPEEGEEEY